MPTKKRITVPGALAHIMSRGISHAEIFVDNADRHAFLDFLMQAITDNGYQCYAWAMMSNHYHLLMRCSENPLDKLMRQLNSRYARYFNMKYKRSGYVFDGRFKSIITQDQYYLEELIRYIHLNPLRAGICKTMHELDRYAWCGHGALLGKTSNLFQTTDVVLRRFGSEIDAARKNYRQFIQNGVDEADKDWLVTTIRKCNKGVEKRNKPECWVIGDPVFVSSVMKKNENRIRMIRAVREKRSLEKIGAIVANNYKIKLSDMKKRSRSNLLSECRKKFAYVCCRVLQFPVSEVAAFFGVSSPAISWAIKRGQRLIKEGELAKFTILPPG